MDNVIRILADGTLLGILAVSGYYLLFRVTDRVRAYPLAIMAGLTSLFVAKLVSVIYQPTPVRPFIEQGVAAGASFVDNPGFPSDHMLLATVAVAAVIALSSAPRWVRGVLIAMTIAMGLGRIGALVHTPLDVIGGVLFGLAGCVWYFTAAQSLRSRR